MPTYNYYCTDCDEYFETVHSMTEEMQVCEVCDSEEYARVPVIPLYITRIIKTKELKAGKLVEEYIKLNKEAVKEEKQKLRSQEYKGE